MKPPSVISDAYYSLSKGKRKRVEKEERRAETLSQNFLF